MYLYMYIKNTGKMANLNGYCLFVLGYYISKESISPIVSLLIEFKYTVLNYIDKTLPRFYPEKQIVF